jgi:hypothetical protein
MILTYIQNMHYLTRPNDGEWSGTPDQSEGLIYL